MADSDFRYCPQCRTELAPTLRGRETRLACPQCSFVLYRNPVPVVAAIVERAGRVVLVHSRGRPEHWFGLVAGFLERGEHPEAAVLREVAEELGVEGRLMSAVGIYPFERLNQVLFVYHVTIADDAALTLAADELDEHREVPLEKLRPWRQGTGPGLRDWLVSRGYDPVSVDFGTPLEL